MLFCCSPLNNSKPMRTEMSMQLMKQQITVQNHQFCSVQSTIPPLLHTATALFIYRFFKYGLTIMILSLQAQAVCFVHMLQSIFRFNSTAMAIPGRGDW
jgi:hypothetical protein